MNLPIRRALPTLALLGAATLGVGIVVAADGPTTAVTPAAASPTAVDAGTLTCTTDANAYCADQPHDLGVVPTSVVATAQAPIGGNNIAATIDADSFTATTFRIRVFKPGGSGYTNRVVTYSYVAYGGPAAPPTTTPVPTATTTVPPPTTTPPGTPGWPAPGTVGLQTTTTQTIAGGRYADPSDFGSPWTGSGTQADPYVLSRVHVTGGLTFGCGCGSSTQTNTWVELRDDEINGAVGNPTPDNSRFIMVENDGPHLTILRSNVRPAGTLDAHGIRTDNQCSDKGLLAYRPFVVMDSHFSGANVLVATELEQNETGTVVSHNELNGICSNGGDHTDVYNENGHGSNTVVSNNYIDGSRSGGAVVNNALGLYNDNIGQCDGCATTKNHTIVGNRIVHYNIGILQNTNTSLTLGPQVVRDNAFDNPTALGASGGVVYDARTPTDQAGNTVNGQSVAF